MYHCFPTAVLIIGLLTKGCGYMAGTMLTLLGYAAIEQLGGECSA